ncbi:MAG: hypothetical protein ACI8RD_014501 [Bacillariaceae sp.]|jgi:hypothetical protein
MDRITAYKDIIFFLYAICYEEDDYVMILILHPSIIIDRQTKWIGKYMTCSCIISKQKDNYRELNTCRKLQIDGNEENILWCDPIYE